MLKMPSREFIDTVPEQVRLLKANSSFQNLAVIGSEAVENDDMSERSLRTPVCVEGGQ